MGRSSQTQRWIDEAKRIRREFLDPVERRWNPNKCICVPNGVQCAPTCKCPGHLLRP